MNKLCIFSAGRGTRNNNVDGFLVFVLGVLVCGLGFMVCVLGFRVWVLSYRVIDI